jgi:hypothetical protein
MTSALYVMEIGGSECITTQEVRIETGSEMEAASALLTFWEDTFQTYQSEDCRLLEVRCGEAALIVGLTGSAALTSAPANTALIVQKNTGTTVRGRSFWPGLAEEDVDAGGRVGAELRSLLTGAYITALAAIQLDGVFPTVASESSVDPDGVTITSFQPRPLVGTLRNRIVGR